MKTINNIVLFVVFVSLTFCLPQNDSLIPPVYHYLLFREWSIKPSTLATLILLLLAGKYIMFLLLLEINLTLLHLLSGLMEDLDALV